MKPVEDVFSSDVLRRVVLPGIVLSAGLHPLISGWIPIVTSLYGVGATTFAVAEVLILGLATSSSIQWIYYVYEGFRLGWVTFPARRLNQARVERCLKTWQETQGERDFDTLSPEEQATVTRIYEHLLDFPLARTRDGSSAHTVERPTRLGNIIATYETYAESRYGFDGTYFWNHLLNFAPDGSRRAFDDAYAFAESLVLASFAGAVVAILHLVVVLGFLAGSLAPSFILFRVSWSPPVSVWLMVLGALVWLAFYRAALPAHREAGAALRAIVDVSLPKFLEWAKSVRVPPADETVTRVDALNEYLKSLAPPEVVPPRAGVPGRRPRRRHRR